MVFGGSADRRMAAVVRRRMNSPVMRESYSRIPPDSHLRRAHRRQVALGLRTALFPPRFDRSHEELAEGGERVENAGIYELRQREQLLRCSHEPSVTSMSFCSGVPVSSTRRREGNCARLLTVALPEEDLRRCPSSQTRRPAWLPLMTSA